MKTVRTILFCLILLAGLQGCGGGTSGTGENNLVITVVGINQCLRSDVDVLVPGFEDAEKQNSDGSVNISFPEALQNAQIMVGDEIVELDLVDGKSSECIEIVVANDGSIVEIHPECRDRVPCANVDRELQ